MAGFQGRQDAFAARQSGEGVEGRLVVSPGILGPAALLQHGVLGTNRWIVKAGANGVGGLNQPGFILENPGVGAVEHSGAATAESGGMVTWATAAAAGFYANQPHVVVIEEAPEQADGVGSSAYAGHRHLGQAACVLEHLLAGLPADHLLEVSYHGWEGMWTQG